MYTRETSMGGTQDMQDLERRSASAPAEAARAVSEPMERSLSNEPANSLIRTVCLVGAGAAILGSIGMQIQGRKHEALFVGQWVPTLVSVALWYQIVKGQ